MGKMLENDQIVAIITSALLHTGLVMFLNVKHRESASS